MAAGKIFPGKQSYNDTDSNRNKVYAKAHVDTGASGVTVYFKVWDVDHDAANTPLDPNGSAQCAGPDNRGSHSPTGITSATTDCTGWAEITVTVSLQPGDNYRFSATTTQSDLQEPNMYWQDADNGTDPTDGKTSGELDVWRKLWVERDSFGEPEIEVGEYIFDGNGKLTGNSTSLTSTVLTDSGEDWRPANQLVGGEVDPDTSDCVYEAIEITASTQTTITGSNLNANASSGDPYEIDVDDDDMGDVPDPDTGELSTAMAQCYV